jgi:hypothetical protein
MTIVCLFRRMSQRSFASDVWNTVSAFIKSQILEVTNVGVSRGSAPTVVTTARIVPTADDNSRFEVGLELPHESDGGHVVEGRGKLPITG